MREYVKNRKYIQILVFRMRKRLYVKDKQGEQRKQMSGRGAFLFHFPGYHGAVENEVGITNTLPAESKHPV